MATTFKRNGHDARRRAALAEFEDYCLLHPRSPAAVRRPQVTNRGRSWVALLGPDLQRGIAGIGSSVEDALRAFDREYINWLRPPPAHDGEFLQDGNSSQP